MNVGAAEAVAGTAAAEEGPPKLNGEAPLAGAAPPPPNENEGVTAPEPGAGEGGAGDGDADGAPKVNAGGLDGLVVAPLPKNELVVAGAGDPNGEAGGRLVLLSFFSVEVEVEVGAPKVKPPDAGAVEPNRDAPPDTGAVLPLEDTPPNEKDGAGAAAEAGSASSSMPLSPASSVTDAGADGGFSVPPKVAALGAAKSFFSSACGVAGVVPKVKVGVVVAGLTAAAPPPKENGAAGLSLSSEAFEAAGAPKENGEAVAGAASDLGAPNANGDLAGCEREEKAGISGVRPDSIQLASPTERAYHVLLRCFVFLGCVGGRRL